jgi:hypothetical protein
MVLFGACSRPNVPGANLLGSCPDAEIEWIDMLMINDIKYQHHFPDPSSDEQVETIEKEKQIGTVSYKMADSACSNHKMKNGDAAFLAKGTPVYSIKGYPSYFVVAADDKVYVVEENSIAKTAGDLYPLKGLVKNIHIESTEDGRRLKAFSPESKEKFLEVWENLKIHDHETLNKKGKFEGERIFLDIELLNGVSFRQVYWADTNTFSSGIIGNETILQIIVDEQK